MALLGLFAIVISLLGLAYYSVLGGWILRYIGLSVQGISRGTGEFFADFTADTGNQIIFYIVYMAITLFIVIRGVAKGIEKACKILMPVLFVFLIIVAVRSCTLDGAAEGLRFYLMPDFSKITPDAWLKALGQVFFSLSVGAGAGITYGAYLSKKESIPKNAGLVAGLDTLAALLAGFAILPAVFCGGQIAGHGGGTDFCNLAGVICGDAAWQRVCLCIFYTCPACVRHNDDCIHGGCGGVYGSDIKNVQKGGDTDLRGRGNADGYSVRAQLRYMGAD